MVRLRNAPLVYRKSPAQALRVTRGRNAKNNRKFVSPLKHKKGRVLDKESLVRAKLQKELLNKPIATPLTDSDDSDGLVTKKRNAGKVQKPIYASGGVADGDIPGAHPSRKRKTMDDGLDEGSSPEKRRQTGQGSGLKRPKKSSLRSPLVPMLPNATLSSSPAEMTSIPVAAAPLASSVPRPNMITSLLPAGETSILGTLKPRKRQPSILQIIETNDSSHLTGDDENEFLPDDESTPLPVSKTTATVVTPGASLRRPNKEVLSSSGLRRPRPVSKKTTPSGIPDAVDSLSFSSPFTPPELPTSALKRQKTPQATEEDRILAPPISSSPDAPPSKLRTKMKNPASSKFKKQPNTQISNALLPSQSLSQSQRPRRQQKQKEYKQATNEFDIPEDSAGSDPRSPAQVDGTSDIHISDGSPFKAQPKSSRRKALPKTKRAISSAPRQRGTSVLSSIGTNSKISKSKNAQGAKSGNDNKAGGGARHFSIISRARGRGAEKENLGLDGGLLDHYEDEQLRKVREKFEEIDEWGLEFEDVLVEEEGSSQAGYR
jgi:hypothetical protein